MWKLPDIYMRSVLGNKALELEVDITRVHKEAQTSAKQTRLVAIDRQTHLPASVRRGLKRAIAELSSPIMDDGDVTPVPIEASRTYRRMADVWAHRNTLPQSETYDTIARTLSATGQFHHKGYTIDQRDQIIGLIEACYLDILHSMETEGYRSDRRSAFATGGIGGLIIWNDGELVSGPAATHRKAAARIPGMTSPFPMRAVGLHRGWLTSVGLTAAQDLRRLPHALRALPGIHSK